MKFKTFRDVSVGIVIGALMVGSVTTAFGKVSQMNIPVSYNNIKIVVDGKQLSTDKEPFIFDGTTYLPVRAVGEAVGKVVSWDGATQTVTLSAKTEAPAETKKEETPAAASSKVVYDANGIKITAQGIGESYLGKEIKLLVENTTAKNYTVQVRDFSINGYMIDPVFSCDVAAGKKANDSISILSQYLEDNGISEIKNVEFSFHIFDSASWESYIDSDVIKIDY